MRKILYTLAVDGYAPEICALTHPLMERYAAKIGAEFFVIRSRCWPDYHATYEKLQIYFLAQKLEADWNIYVDSDTLIHPDTFDPTDHLSKDTVMHNWRDMAGNRWRYDRFFRRDGRHIGSGNWFAVASDWCIDLWKPPDDLTYEECVASCRPTLFEMQPTMMVEEDGKKEKRAKAVITPEHLVDDYILSRNIAKYGLKFATFRELQAKLGLESHFYLWHEYLWTREDKLAQMTKVLKQWGLEVERAATA